VAHLEDKCVLKAYDHGLIPNMCVW